MTKTYVLDTNVLIQAPYALSCFEENNIILPVVVMEELDKLKTADGEKGANARAAIRFLETLRQKGDMIQGVKLPYGGILRLEVNHIKEPLPEGFLDEKNDNRILKVCLGVYKEDKNVILVTKDIVLRIKAQMLGIKAEDFTTEQVPESNLQYSGRMEVYVAEDKFAEFKRKGIEPKYLYTIGKHAAKEPVTPVWNQFFIIKADQSNRKTQLAKFNGEKVVPLHYKRSTPYGIHPKNAGQYFLQEALMESADIAPLVIVKGRAGTAKTFYSLAVGLEKVMELEKKEYRKIVISRPNAQFDDDIGFLPGDEKEKIAPLIRPIIDNLELIVDQDEKERYHDERELSGKIEELFERELIVPQAMNFIRGRSITKTYLIIDEAQNLTPKQAKGIITRVGHGTKVILLGDPNQIDHPLLDERTNGLSYASEKMKGSPLCYQINMLPSECERSKLAMDAILRMS